MGTSDALDAVRELCEVHGKEVMLQIFSDCYSVNELHNCAVRKRYHEDEVYRQKKHAATLRCYKKTYHENEEFRQKKLAKKRAAYHQKKHEIAAALNSSN